MSLKADLNGLLREYAPEKVAVAELNRLNYYFNNIKKNKKWVTGSNYRIDFEAGEHSTFMLGGLPDETKIKGASYIKADIANPATLVGSMLIHEKDLERHKSLEDSFLDFWPEKLKQFTKRMEEKVSILLLGDGSICTATANGTIAGVMTLDRPHLLTIGERVTIDDDNSSPVTCYVKSININTKEVVFATDETLATVADLSGYATANKAKVYVETATGASDKFNNLNEFLFAAANGGSDTIHGLTKTASPILQPLSTSGSTFNTGKKLLEGLYGFYFEYEKLGRSEANEILVDYNAFQFMSLALQSSKWFAAKETSAGIGYKGLVLSGPNGDMKIKALRDLAQGTAAIIDWSAIELAGQNMFKTKHQQNGDLFYTVRKSGSGGGYVHIVDVVLDAQHICKAPSKLAGVYGIPTITAAV